MFPSLPRSVVDDDGGEVVEAGPRVGAPRLVEVGEEVVGHVEAAQRELHVSVQLRPREGRPPEPLQVQAQHLQAKDDRCSSLLTFIDILTENG